MGGQVSYENPSTGTVAPQVQFRAIIPYIGTLGAISYVWEFLIVMWVFFMILSIYTESPWTLIALLLIQFVVYIIFWAINAFYMGPLYRIAPVARRVNEYGDELLIAKEAPNTYAASLARDLKFHNDQTHFQSVVWSTLFVLIFYGVFLRNGTIAASQFLPPGYFAPAVENYVLNKIFQALVLAIAAHSWNLLFESQSDFLFRHLTAQNVQLVRNAQGSSAADDSMASKQRGYANNARTRTGFLQ
jgi:hypothetical protein